MSLPQTTRSKRAWQSVAAALLLVLMTALFAPFAMAQDSGNPLPACCRDAHSCSLHLHHAAQAASSGYHLAAVQSRCPCLPLAPANASTHGVPYAAAAGIDDVRETQESLAFQQSTWHRWLRYAGDGTRGPPPAHLT